MILSKLARDIDKQIGDIVDPLVAQTDRGTRKAIVLQLRFEMLCRILEEQRFLIQVLEQTIAAHEEIRAGVAFDVPLTESDVHVAGPKPRPDLCTDPTHNHSASTRWCHDCRTLWSDIL